MLVPILWPTIATATTTTTERITPKEEERFVMLSPRLLLKGLKRSLICDKNPYHIATSSHLLVDAHSVILLSLLTVWRIM